jgi:Ca-activated chloride channel homolog
MRLPFLLRLLAAISIALVAQDAKSWRNQQRDSKATIRVTADLVLVPVTVTESSGKPVLGLEKRDFVLTDEKVVQEIRSFSREIAPVSIGIVFDLSGCTRIPSVPRNWG